MAIIVRKSIRISSITERLLQKQFPDLVPHGTGHIVDCMGADAAGLPRPRTPEQRQKAGAKKRGKKLKGQPALNPKGRKKKDANE